MSKDNGQTRGVHLSILVLCLGAWSVATLGVLSHNGITGDLLDSTARFLTACPLGALSDQRCILCGTITALAMALDGDVSGSLATNPLAIGLVPLGASQPVYRIIRVLAPRFRPVEELAVTGTGLAILLLVIAVN